MIDGKRKGYNWHGAVRLPMFRRSQVLGIRWCTQESDQSFDVLGSGIVWSCPWLSGSVAELGEQMGIPVPRNRAVTDILALYVAGQKST
jgi:hypothetical protein